MTFLAPMLLLVLAQEAVAPAAPAPDSVSSTVIAVILPRAVSPSMIEALSRLRGEGASVGIEILSVDISAEVDREPQAQVNYVARALAPAAVVALVEKTVGERPNDNGPPEPGATSAPVAAIDAWLLDRSTGKTSIGHLTVDKGVSDQMGLVLAVRVVDFIRAHLFDVIVRRRLDEAKEKQRQPVSRPMVGRGCLTLGVASTGSASGFSPVSSPFAQLGFSLRPWLWLTLAGSGYGTQFRRQTASGDASVDQKSVSVGVVVLPHAWWRVAPFVSAGAALAFVSVHGQGSINYQGHDVSTWSPGAFASVGGVFMLSSRLLFQVSAGALVLTREPRVWITDVEVARTGRPAWLGNASLGVTF